MVTALSLSCNDDHGAHCLSFTSLTEGKYEVCQDLTKHLLQVGEISDKI